MGDYADMMLEGDLCCDCGVFLSGQGDGGPRRCRDCKQAAKHEQHRDPTSHRHAICPTCNKRVKFVGLRDHQRDAHGS